MTTRLSHIAVGLFALGLFSLPLAAFAEHEDGHTTPTSVPYQFQNEGIFGCNRIGGLGMSAGTMAAIGGVYVPVNDAAVTLNTGILVYKECILRPLQVKLRESAMSALFNRAQQGIQTGRNGNPRYVVQPTDERVEYQDRAMYAFMTDGALDSIHPAFKTEVSRALLRNYQWDTRGERQPKCLYSGDLRADIQNPTRRPFDITNFEMLADTNCNPFFAYQNEQNVRDERLALADQQLLMMWEWGNGFYPGTDNTQDPLAERIVTPPSVVDDSYQTILDSPVRQLESANDLGQMIGALYAGVTTHALTSTGGLAGLTQRIGGQPSYLEQIVRESSQGVIGAAINAALKILGEARAIETRFLAAMEGIAKSLVDTATRLRDTEKRCWDLIVPKAQEYARTGTCTSSGEPPTQTCTPFELDQNKIKASTSTLAFSQQVIDSQLTPLAGIAGPNVEAAKKALALIDELIRSVTNTTSITAQRIALQQLDALVNQNLLHTQYDATRAEQQKGDVDKSMNTLVEDTAKAWGDSPDPTVGWCNINNPNVIKAWAEKWKK